MNGNSGGNSGVSAAVTIDYDASARQDGVFSSVASLTSDITPGVTQQVVTLTVTK